MSKLWGRQVLQLFLALPEQRLCPHLFLPRGKFCLLQWVMVAISWAYHDLIQNRRSKWNNNWETVELVFQWSNSPWWEGLYPCGSCPSSIKWSCLNPWTEQERDLDARLDQEIQALILVLVQLAWIWLVFPEVSTGVHSAQSGELLARFFRNCECSFFPLIFWNFFLI